MIAITHGHDDHVGNTIDLVEKFGCTVVAPVELADWLVWMKKAVPEDKIRDPNKGGTVDVDGVKVTLTDANHSSSTIDEDHMVYLGEPVGLVFEAENGTKLYFAGDTNVFGDMQLIKRLYAPDVAILPIGGHFTMDPREAAVALEFLGASKVRAVPLRDVSDPHRHARPASRARARTSRSWRSSPGRRSRFEAALVRRDASSRSRSSPSKARSSSRPSRSSSTSSTMRSCGRRTRRALRSSFAPTPRRRCWRRWPARK